MKYTLTYCRNDKPKLSEKINPKTDKPYEYFFCSIRVEELDEWINGFGNETTKEWEEKLLDLPKEERKIEIDVYIYEEEYKEKMYKKFKFLSEKDRLALENEELKKKLAKVDVVEKAEEKRVEASSRVKAEDLPFN